MKKASWFFWAFVGLVWLVIGLPFAGDSLKALLEFPDTPPSSQEELGKLLQNIIYAANFSILSVLVLYGLNRGWHKSDGYPKFLRRLDLQTRFTNLFENKPVLAVTNTVLALLAVAFSIFLFLHGRMLVRA
jgi:hypothetical protein